MNRVLKFTLMAGTAAVLFSGSVRVWAQPSFDPAEMRQRMITRYRTLLEIKSDDEWKVIQARIEKILEARQGLGGGGFGMMMGPGGPGGSGPGGPGGPGGDGGDGGGPGGGGPGGDGGGPGGPGGGGPPGMMQQSLPEAEALQQAIKAASSKEEIKAKLASYREARKAKRAKLESAQSDLQPLLTQKQEATAVLIGLLE